MQDHKKTKKQLVEELDARRREVEALRRELAELRASSSEPEGEIGRAHV